MDAPTPTDRRCARRLLALLTAIVLLVAAAPTAGAAGGRIAMVVPTPTPSTGGADYGISTIAPDGSDLTSVVQFHDNVFIDTPVFSPDGRTIVFRVDGGFVFGVNGAMPRLWAVGDDGSDVRQLDAAYQPTFYSGDITPSWSPDGTVLLFARSDAAGYFQLWSMTAAGADPRQIVQGDPRTNSISPEYSPDGSRLAYVTGTYFDRQVTIANVDGSDPHVVTDESGDVSWVRWSPDGAALVFSVQTQEGEFTVHTIAPDGSGERTLTDGSYQDEVPFWSPDGSQIAFNRAQVSDGRFHLYVMNADGTQLHAVPNAPIGAVATSWTASERTPTDTAPPLLACDSPDTTWHAGDMSIVCSASDDGSGLANASDATFALTTSVPAGTANAAAPTDARTVCDRAGNCTTAGPYTFKVDREPPVITCPTPAAVFTVGEAAASVTATVGDGGGAGPVATTVSATADTTSPTTTRMANLSAVDLVGNTTSASCAYAVVFAWSGFFAPVRNPPTFNSAQAGKQKIPLKFSLRGPQGLGVLAGGSPSSRRIDCATAVPLDAIELPTESQSGLSYDPLADRYMYSWTTDSAWTRTCREFVLRLVDGTVHVAYFSFR